jgi:hypothetical protein
MFYMANIVLNHELQRLMLGVTHITSIIKHRMIQILNF